MEYKEDLLGPNMHLNTCNFFVFDNSLSSNKYHSVHSQLSSCPYSISLTQQFSPEDLNTENQSDAIFICESGKVEDDLIFIRSIPKEWSLPIFVLCDSYDYRTVASYYDLGIKECITYEQLPFLVERVIREKKMYKANSSLTFSRNHSQAMWLVGSDMKCLDANDKALEIVGEKDKSVFRDAFILGNYFVEEPTSNSEKFKEICFLTVNGLKYFMNFEEFFNYREDGSLENILIIGHEFSNQKKKLDQEIGNKDLKLISNTAGVGYWEYDILKQKFDINDAYLNIVDYTREEYDTDPVIWLNKIMSHGEVEKLWSLFEQTFIDRNLSNIEKEYVLELKKKDGTTIYTYQKIHSIETKDQLLITGICIDISEQIKIKAALEKSEFLLKKAQEITKISNWQLDIDDIQLNCANELYNLIPIFDESLKNSSLIQVLQKFSSLEKFRLIKNCITVIASSKEVCYELKLYDEEVGQYKWFQHRIYKLNQGSSTKLFGTVQDISEYKKSLISLNQSNQKYKMLIEQASDSIVTFDNKGKVIQANSITGEMLGYEEDELQKLSIYDIFSKKGINTLLEEFFGVSLENDIVYIRNIYLISKDNQRIPVEINARKLTNGNLHTIIRNVSLRIQQEKELRVSNDKNKTILKAIPDTMLVVNEVGIILDFYDHKKNKEAIIHTRAEDFFPKGEFEKINKCFRKARLNYDTFVTEYSIENQYDTEYFEVRIRVLTSNDFLVILRDITEIKLAQINLNAVNKELETFMYNASHKLLGPICSIEGLLTIVKCDSDTTECIYMNKIASQVKQLRDSLTELVEVTKIKEGIPQIEEVNFDNASGMVSKILEDCEDVKGSCTMMVKGEFYSNEQFLIQSIKKILHNAISYRRYKAEHTVDVHITVENDICDILVKDNGIGILNESKDLHFDMFYKENNVSSGPGLGLYISKEIVKTLKGKISIKNNDGDGATVHLTLPNLKGYRG